MAVRIVTARYVKALFQAAQKTGEQSAIGAELDEIESLLRSSPDLKAVLEDPRLQPAAQQKVLKSLVGARVKPLLQSFLDLCIERRRPEVVLEAAEEFRRLDQEARGVMVAKVETAVALSDAMRGSLQAKLEEMTGKSVKLVEETNEELLGGVRIQIGTRMYDGSVRRRLDDLAAHLRSSRAG